MPRCRWPSPAQLRALADAICQQRSASHVCLRMLEELDPVYLEDSINYGTLVEGLCDQLALRGQHVTGLTLQTGSLDGFGLRRITAVLAGLPSLQQLTYNTWRLDHTMVPPLTALTGLTSLTLGSLHSTAQATATLAQQLQLLAQLSLLQSLTLTGRLATGGADLEIVALPAWPHLRHLHLGNSQQEQHHNLQLSAEHCARLEALTGHYFHAAEGVASMEQLTQLTRCPSQ